MRGEQNIIQKETSSAVINSKSVKVLEMSIKSRSKNISSITREGPTGEDYIKPFSRIVNPENIIKPEDILY